MVYERQSGWQVGSAKVRAKANTSRVSLQSRMGTMYLMAPKIRNGGYIPVFVESRKRSEAINVQEEIHVQNCYECTFRQKDKTRAKE